MPQQPGLHIDRWFTGLYTNRAATSTPFRYSYGKPITFNDALIGGLNLEITTKNTLARRPGWNGTLQTQIRSTETATTFHSAILSGNVVDFLATTQNIYTFTASTIHMIWRKQTTTPTRFQQVGNNVYFMDGTDNKKVSVEPDGTLQVSDAGVDGPTAAPSIPFLNNLTSFQTTHGWVASQTYFGGAGFTPYYLMAPTGEIYFAYVPPGTQMTSGATQPNWAAAQGTFGAVVTDGTMLWTNCGTPAAWSASTAYVNKNYQLNNGVYTKNSTAVVAGSGAGVFANWQGQGSAWGAVNSSGHTGVTNALQVTGLGLSVPTGATVKGLQATVFRASNRTNSVVDSNVQLLVAGSPAGTNKAAGGYWPQTEYGVYTIPTSGGVAQTYGSPVDTWGVSLTPAICNASNFGIEFIANQLSQNTTAFGLTPDTSNNNVIVDITVFYTIPGSSLVGTNYFQIVVDSNGNLQAATTAGTSGGTAPSWNTTVNGTTSDGTVTWTNLGTGTLLPPQFQWTYAYGYHTTGVTEHLSTLSPTITINAPILGANVELQTTGQMEPILVPNATATNGTTGWTTTATSITVDTTTSPVPGGNSFKVAATGQFQNAMAVQTFSMSPGDTISVSSYLKSDGTSQPAVAIQFWNEYDVFISQLPVGSSTSTAWTLFSITGVAPQGTLYAKLVIDTNSNASSQNYWFYNPAIQRTDNALSHIDLYRTQDAGGLLYYNTSAPNVPGASTFIYDTALDTALNFELIGPVAHLNDPPPDGITNLTYYQQRIWGWVGNVLFFSGGPDTANGDGAQAWPPANNLVFPASGIGLAPTTQGLIAATTDDTNVVLGGPQTTSYWYLQIKANRGILNPNCMTQDGDDVVMFTSQSKLFSFSPTSENWISEAVNPTISSIFSPATSSITIHRNGSDQGIFISDGSTNVMRYNMNTESWDTVQQPTLGIGVIKSITTALGTHALASILNRYIVFRTPTTFVDGTFHPFPAYADVGSLILSEPGEPPVLVKHVVTTSARVGTPLAISVMLNEIVSPPGAFTNLPVTIPDPYLLGPSQSIDSYAYPLKANQAALPQLVKHMQVRITFPPNDTVQNEVFTLAIIPEQ